MSDFSLDREAMIEGLNLTLADIARVDEFERTNGLTPEDILRAAMNGVTTDDGRPGITTPQGMEIPFLTIDWGNEPASPAVFHEEGNQSPFS